MLYREKNGKANQCRVCFLAFDILHGMQDIKGLSGSTIYVINGTISGGGGGSY
jgi:hypothetical protein